MSNHTVRIQNVAKPQNSVSPHLLLLPFPTTFNSPDMATPSSSDMATVSLGTLEHEPEANHSFVDEIREAVELFVTTLNQIALTHGRCEFLFILCYFADLTVTHNAVPRNMCGYLVVSEALRRPRRVPQHLSGPSVRRSLTK